MNYLYWFKVIDPKTRQVMHMDWSYDQEVCSFMAVLWIITGADVETWITYDEE